MQTPLLLPKNPEPVLSRYMPVTGRLGVQLKIGLNPLSIVDFLFLTYYFHLKGFLTFMVKR